MKPFAMCLWICLVVALSSGCVSMGVHRSARSVGKDKTEVGFSMGYPSWKGVYTTAGALGGAEGFLRHGLTEGIDFSVTAGCAGITPRLDWNFIRSKNLNVAAGFGLGIASATASTSYEQLVGGFVAVPDFTGLISVGSAVNEFTVGVRAMAATGGGLVQTVNIGTEYGIGSETVAAGGGLIAFTHRGKRLNVTPELDLYIGRNMTEVGFLIIPSIAFSTSR